MKTIIINLPNPNDEAKKSSAMREESVGTFNFNTSIDDDQYRHLGFVLKALNLQFEIENHFKKTIDNKVEKQVAVTIIRNDGRINPHITLDFDDSCCVWYVLRVSKVGDPGYIEYNIQLYGYYDVFVSNDALGCGDDYRKGYCGLYSNFLPTLFKDIQKKLNLGFRKALHFAGLSLYLKVKYISYGHIL